MRRGPYVWHPHPKTRAVLQKHRVERVDARNDEPGKTGSSWEICAAKKDVTDRNSGRKRFAEWEGEEAESARSARAIPPVSEQSALHRNMRNDWDNSAMSIKENGRTKAVARARDDERNGVYNFKTAPVAKQDGVHGNRHSFRKTVVEGKNTHSAREQNDWYEKRRDPCNVSGTSRKENYITRSVVRGRNDDRKGAYTSKRVPARKQVNVDGNPYSYRRESSDEDENARSARATSAVSEQNDGPEKGLDPWKFSTTARKQTEKTLSVLRSKPVLPEKEPNPLNLETELKYLKDPLKLANHIEYILKHDKQPKAMALIRLSSRTLTNIVSWNHMIDWQMKNGKTKAALDTYNEVWYLKIVRFGCAALTIVSTAQKAWSNPR